MITRYKYTIYIPVPLNDYAKTVLFPIILPFNLTIHILPSLFPMFFMGDLYLNPFYTHKNLSL